MKKIKVMLKNQKGLTLVELLAVVVILGIIAAIAVPSIGNIIDKSKKDAHEANAEMMISAGRMAVAANQTSLWGASSGSGDDVGRITMTELVNNGYLEGAIEDPDNIDNTASDGTAHVTVTDNDGKFSYSVELIGDKRKVTGSPNNLKVEKNNN